MRRTMLNMLVAVAAAVGAGFAATQTADAAPYFGLTIGTPGYGAYGYPGYAAYGYPGYAPYANPYAYPYAAAGVPPVSLYAGVPYVGAGFGFGGYPYVGHYHGYYGRPHGYYGYGHGHHGHW